MASAIDAIRDAILNDAAGEEIAALPIPESMRAVTTHRDDAEAQMAKPAPERDPRETLHLDTVPVPEPAAGEALVAVMAAAVNHNTVWAATFEPVSTFAFLERFGRAGPLGKRHDLPYHIQGSDAAGVVLRVGEGVTRWSPGDWVVINPMFMPLEQPQGHDDGMRDPEQRVYGYETNFGSFASICLVRANQLMRKPAHLTWEEAASMPLVSTTVYRMLVGRNGAEMKQGDVVLIWGAATGIGGFATQYVLNGGGIPVCVVSSPARVAALRQMGVERIIDRNAEGFEFWKDGQQDARAIRGFGRRIRDLTDGEDPDIVFEHPGRATFGASVYVAKTAGKIVTCAATSGFLNEFDNRFLWISLKRIIGSHLGNYAEGWAANRLAALGMIQPMLSATYPLEAAAEAVGQLHANAHTGKVALRVLAPEEGLGVSDPAKRERIGPQLARFRPPA